MVATIIANGAPAQGDKHETKASGAAGLWTHVRYAFWLLWLSRVSAASALIGIVLFAFTPQAQDMFLEIKAWDILDKVYWMVFCGLVVFCWGQAVHGSAETIIARCDDWGLETRAAHAIRVAIPLTLGALCYVGVLLGQYSALRNLDWLSRIASEKGELDLTLLSAFYIALLIQGFLIVFALYLLFHIFRAFNLEIGWKFVACALFAIVALSAAWYYAMVGALNNFNDALVAGHRSHTGVLLEFFLERDISLRVHSFLPALFFCFLILAVAGVVRATRGTVTRLSHPLVTVWLTLGIIGFVVLDPATIVNVLPRAILAPIILWLWVPALTWLTWKSRTLKAPLFLLLLSIPIVWSVLRGDNYDVKRIPASQSAGPIGHLDINSAVALWKRNIGGKCAESKEPKVDCPRPVVVAASGGASRAAFFTASVLGRLMDDSRQATARAGADQRALQFRDHLFAISSVSGSSLGAAVFSAALKLSDPKTGAPPCGPNADTSLWFRTTVDAMVTNPRAKLRSNARAAHQESWKDCLQLLLSADFLSPVFVGLAFTDATSIGCFGDRGSILESAWARHFENVTVGSKGWNLWSQFCNPLGGHRTSELAGLSAPFGSLAPRQAAAQENARWQPLLVFNSTSVETGRRILASHFKPEYCVDGSEGAGACLDGKAREQLFPDSYDLYRLLDAPAEVRGWLARMHPNAVPQCDGRTETCDISLSSAALLSGRFPVVSPHGNIRGIKGQIVDRGVDGGYFENYGATTAQDIVLALQVLGLEPVVILITNDPDLPDLPCLTDRRETAETPNASNVSAFGLFGSPAAALYNTGTARGNSAAVSLCETMASSRGRQSRSQGVLDGPGNATAAGATDSNGCMHDRGLSFAHFRVWRTDEEKSARRASPSAAAQRSARAQTLSLSWWLSKPVQQHLDYQLKHPTNDCTFQRVEAGMKPG